MNGLDEDIVSFTYELVKYSDETIELQLNFDCPECISSFDTDIMTVVGLNGEKVLFEYDVIMPP